VDWTLDNQLDADGRRQMKNHVTLVNQFGDDGRVMHRVNRVMKTRVRFEVLDILEAAGRKVVNHVDFIAAFQINVGKVRPDKARPACNQNSQTVYAPFAEFNNGLFLNSAL
jgi:hypothetical protein